MEHKRQKTDVARSQRKEESIMKKRRGRSFYHRGRTRSLPMGVYRKEKIHNYDAL